MRSDRTINAAADSERLSLLVVSVIYLIVGVIFLNFARIALTTLADHLDWSGQTLAFVYTVPLLTAIFVNGYTVIRIGDRRVVSAYMVMGLLLSLAHLLDVLEIDKGLPGDLQPLMTGGAYLLLSYIFYRVIRLLLDTDQQRKQRLLENLAWGTSHRVGTDFLYGLVSTIVDTLNVQHAFVSEINADLTREEILSAASAVGHEVLPELQPGREVVCSQSGVKGLAAPGQSLFLIELTDSEERTIGHLGLLHAESERVSRGQRSSLQIFASRASAELLRIRADRKSEEMEARMLQVQKLESLGVLAGGIAHDFNNLLQAIRSYATISGDSHAGASDSSVSSEPAGRAAIEQIEAIVDKGATMCNRLLAYAGRAVRRNDVCEINGIVRETAAIIQAARSDCRVKLDLSSSPLNVWGDATQLSQVIMNMLTNAADAIDADSGLITVGTSSGFGNSTLASGMELDADEQFAFIEVIDNGCGIDDDALMKLFDPFFTSKGKGRGIGLAAVAGIVKDHQGDISIRTKLSVGTTFVIAFPVTDRQAEVSPHQLPLPQESSEAEKILLVDDDALVRDSTRLLLEASGLSVTTAASGSEALELITGQELSFSCILLDQTMPGLSGIETCRRLREMGDNSPVVLMSGYSEVGLDDTVPAVRFLSKPCVRHDLLVAIADATGASAEAVSERPVAGSSPGA